MTLKWAWPGSRDPVSKFWDPLITFEEYSYQLQIWYIQDGPLRRVEHKMTLNFLKWAWPGSRDPISKFWDPVITFERIELSV